MLINQNNRLSCVCLGTQTRELKNVTSALVPFHASNLGLKPEVLINLCLTDKTTITATQLFFKQHLVCSQRFFYLCHLYIGPVPRISLCLDVRASVAAMV